MPNETDTAVIEKQNPLPPDSTIMGVSVRAWIVLMLVGTVCLSFLAIIVAVLVEAVAKGDWAKVGTYTTVSEPLYGLVMLAVGFYFGKPSSKS